MAIPEDLSERLIRLHGHPFVWFIGQLAKYFLRPQSWLNELFEKQYQAIQFQKPIVGYGEKRYGVHRAKRITAKGIFSQKKCAKITMAKIILSGFKQ